MKQSKSRVPMWVHFAIPTVLMSLWLGMLSFGGPYFGRIDEVSSIDLTTFLPQSAEATKVAEEAKQFQSQKTLPAIVALTADDGIFDSETDVVNKRLESLVDLNGVVSKPSPLIVAEDKKAAFGIVQLDSNKNIQEMVTEIKQSLSKPGLEAVDYKMTGPAGFSADINKAFAGIDGILLFVALAVVFVILLIVYRSVLLPVIVLLTSLAALTAVIFIVWQLANAGMVKLNGQVQGILFILVIGAATDYSLLYVARYREELYRLHSKWEATHAALEGSIEPIIASGSTVIVGLLCILLSDLESNKALGPVGAIGIVMSMAAAFTFLPVILYTLGRSSYWPMTPRADVKSRKEHERKIERGVWRRVAEFVKRHSRIVWVASTLGLVILSLGITQLRANGVSQSQLVMGYSEAREGQSILNKHFPAGSGSPVMVIADVYAYESLVLKLDNDKGVASVAVQPEKSSDAPIPIGKNEANIRAKIRKEVEKEYNNTIQNLDTQEQELALAYGPEVASVIMSEARSQIPSVDSIVDEAYPFKDASPKIVDNRVMMLVTLNDAPDSNEAKDSVIRIRDLAHRENSTTLVGGSTAAQIDTNDASIRDRAVIIPVILLAITLILMILLRSIIAPLFLLLTTVLSFGASIGLAALLFNHVWKFPGADPSVVLYAFVFLVALGIDYNIFLMTRVREETLKLGTGKGILRGLVVTGGVITSAGIVLAATFAALVVIPILFLFQLAFIVAFGVLLDTILVRSLLVPAFIRDIGPIVWWPSKLKNKK